VQPVLHVLPHAVIRPVLKDTLTLKRTETFETKDAVGFKGYKFRIHVSPTTAQLRRLRQCLPRSHGQGSQDDTIADPIEREANNWNTTKTSLNRPRLPDRPRQGQPV
jgi:hypothetical protein